MKEKWGIGLGLGGAETKLKNKLLLRSFNHRQIALSALWLRRLREFFVAKQSLNVANYTHRRHSHTHVLNLN